jgi:hypothetical protein
MEDSGDSIQGLVHIVLRSDTSLDECESVFIRVMLNILHASRIQVIKHNHLVFLNQSINKMTADEPCSTSDKNALHTITLFDYLAFR